MQFEWESVNDETGNFLSIEMTKNECGNSITVCNKGVTIFTN